MNQAQFINLRDYYKLKLDQKTTLNKKASNPAAGFSVQNKNLQSDHSPLIQEVPDQEG